VFQDHVERRIKEIKQRERDFTWKKKAEIYKRYGLDIGRYGERKSLFE